MTSSRATSPFFPGGSAAPPLLDRRPRKRKGCAGSSTKVHVGLETRVDTSTNARDAVVHTPSYAVSNKERVAQGTSLEKGMMPVRLERMLPFLNRYLVRVAAHLLETGFKEGFRIPSSLREVLPVAENLRSALLHPEVVSAKLFKEVALGCMAGPFPAPPLPGLIVSPLGVVPKKEVGQYRMIHHLSYPKGGSVNDGIDPQACAVTYTSFDAAVSWVRKYGRGSLMAKTDVESAFRLLPVHPQSVYLMGCCWQGSYFVDHCLPMGCSISCALFEVFSSFFEWAVREAAGVNSVIHYLDDFLCVGPPRLPLLWSVTRDFTTPG